MNRGVWYAMGAYLIWGLLPIFWKALHHVPALEIMAHRVVWALLAALILLTAWRRWPALWAALRSRRTLLTYSATAVLLSGNWLLYIWAVNAGFVVETSLGYFINPLLSVLLGMLFLGERLRVGQAVAIGVAALGVIFLAVMYGSPPWIALGLGGSFAIYGLLRKVAALESLPGFALETLLMFPVAFGYLAFLGAGGGGVLGHTDLATTLLLASSGIVTAVPLILFAAGARQINLTLVGILQYIAPSIQFTLGVTLFGEHLSPQRLIGFAIIWLALAIYTAESLWWRAGRKKEPLPYAGTRGA